MIEESILTYEQEKASGQYVNCQQQPMRETLTSRLHTNLSRAKRESRKVIELEELISLLNKNPEVARILDLVEQIGTY